MTGSIISSLASIAVLLIACPSHAQASRLDQIEAAKADKAARTQPPEREIGDVVVTRVADVFMPEPPAARLTFGDFRPGAGIALGATYEAPVGDRGLWTGTGAVSLNRFKEIESTIEIPPFTTDRVRVRGIARWADAPDLRFFGLGMDASRDAEMTYGLRSTEAGGDLRIQGPWRVRFGGSLQYLRTQPRGGTGDVPAAGVTRAAAWTHSAVSAEIDTRRSPGYTTTGGLYRVTLHDYAGHDAAPSFGQTEVDLRQFIPFFNDNWIVALQARAQVTESASHSEVPFFMLPYIGGRDSLPGFDNYRFTDRNALLLRGELRWTPAPVVDMAIFLDTGTVAATVGDLDVHDLQHSWGLGARLHGSTFTALRLQVAHSPEGWRYNIAQGVSF